MSFKNNIIVGFMLFAMFFGAGNLIFPPGLGFDSGQYFWMAIIGFVITGVGLPLIGVIAGSISKDGYRESLKVVHPIFAIIFMVIIYLAIGPFFAIPRTATTAYEMAMVPFINGTGWVSLLIFTLVFFGIVFALSYNPSRMVDNIGRFLTPVLLVTIIALIVKAITMYIGNDSGAAAESFDSTSPFSVGFTEGYLTMDAIAAIAFSVIVLNSIRSLGVTKRKDLLIETIKSASIAAFLLGVIYISLGWIGNHVSPSVSQPEDQNLGTFLLTFVAEDSFGQFGTILLGVIVAVACLTTATGLVVAVSEYFNSILPKISYETFVIIFTLISLVLANQGLTQVIQTSVPVLSIIYPIAMASVALLFLTYFIPSPRLSFQIPIYLIIVTSILAVVHRNGWFDFGWIENMPLFQSSFEWIPVMVIGYIVGYLIGMKQERVKYS
ncbi:branched-chain amino acid transport system II carrier protein [Salinicoccus hispanicus]|uniref:Branched-chain amino acid transport system carrier protein n=1 Tax=Salinicoccus hispanicus TaxID=157225 RepID=A0A6N8TWM1_9STAP|nr:branched-chain amino acid transport system II carrier protein [Salinicoccus hispanicus]MXQ50328.1 branched-chain amino acid transport system II carrier protein [Salinicoccus hispanicus]